MTFNNVLAALVVPPIGLLLAALVGFFLAWRWPRVARTLIGLALLGLLVLSLPVTGMALITSLECCLPEPAADAAPPGAIVILSADAGYGAFGSVEPGSGIGAMTLQRMRAGALLQRRTHLPLLVTGGVLEDGAEPIATQMARSLREDFSTEVRWVEPASQDTWENARLSAVLLRQSGITSVYLVTHAWHMRRALLAFSRAGITARAAPVRLDPSPRWVPGEFLPSVSSWLNDYFALHEWIGIAYYSLRR